MYLSSVQKYRNAWKLYKYCNIEVSHFKNLDKIVLCMYLVFKVYFKSSAPADLAEIKEQSAILTFSIGLQHKDLQLQQN